MSWNSWPAIGCAEKSSVRKSPVLVSDVPSLVLMSSIEMSVVLAWPTT